MSNRGSRARWIAVGCGGGAAVLFAASWQACSIYDASLLLPASDAGADGGFGVDAPAEVSIAPDADTCAHVHWPAPPPSDDPPAAAPSVVIDALRTFEIAGAKDAGAEAYGFDLDGICTCPGPDSCQTPAGSTPRCDGPGGRDNTGGELLRTLGSFNVFNSDALTARLAAGYYGLLIMVRDYNGAANDTRVTVAVFVSNGIEGSADASTFPPPRFDGTDHWTVDPGSLLGGSNVLGVDCSANVSSCVPLYFDDKAYVTNHVLVGSLDFPLSLGGGAKMGAVALDLTGSVVTARIVARGASFALAEGQIAGRWATSKLLSSLSVLPDPLASGAFLCGDDPTYQGFKSKICSSTDITADPKADEKGAACDALSVSFGFTAEPARLGTVVPSSATARGCEDGGAPFHDECAPP